MKFPMFQAHLPAIESALETCSMVEIDQQAVSTEGEG